MLWFGRKRQRAEVAEREIESLLAELRLMIRDPRCMSTRASDFQEHELQFLRLQARWAGLPEHKRAGKRAESAGELQELANTLRSLKGACEFDFKFEDAIARGVRGLVQVIEAIRGDKSPAVVQLVAPEAVDSLAAAGLTRGQIASLQRLRNRWLQSPEDETEEQALARLRHQQFIRYLIARGAFSDELPDQHLPE
jgi:hypothetical protein